MYDEKLKLIKLFFHRKILFMKKRKSFAAENFIIRRRTLQGDLVAFETVSLVFGMMRG